jgi:hypothetical protein
MYQRAPRTPETNRISDTAELTFAEQQRLAHRLRRGAKLAGVCLAATALVSHYSIDVTINRAHEEAASIQITEHKTDENATNELATIFSDGYGSMNATVLARKFGSVVQNVDGGLVKSADFGDAPISIRNLAQEVIEDANEDGSTVRNFFGFSAGGLINLEAASTIINDPDSNLRIKTIYLAGTPNGPESLAPDQVENIALLNFLAEQGDNEYSSVLRFGISMASDYEQYEGKGITGFFDTWNSNMEQIRNRSEPGVRQLDDQALLIMNADVSKTLEEIGSMRGQKQMPVIVYLAGTNDTTVDNDTASESICKAAEEAGIQCLILVVPGAIHSVYNTNVDTYREVLIEAKDDIQALVESEDRYLEHATLARQPYPTSFDPQ